MELLPETPDHFLFRAKVRHDDAEGAAETGIYIGLKARASPDGDVLGYCALTFNDFEGAEPPPNKVTMPIRFYRVTNPVDAQTNTAPLTTFTPAGRTVAKH